MPQNVVRRVSSHRKNNDGGHRSDSGCFDDVDVLQSNRQSPINNICDVAQSSGNDPPLRAGNYGCETPPSSQHQLSSSQHQSSPSSSSQQQLPDDVGDESCELREIIERLAEVTKNPADLYRLCFSSRLSFTPSFNVNEEDSLNGNQSTEEYSGDSVKVNKDEPASQQFLNKEAVVNSVAQNQHEKHGDCGNQDQCVELLAIFSSFMEKANKNAAIFNQSGLGRSLMGHFSSLLSTLETAKKDVVKTCCEQNADDLISDNHESDDQSSNGNNGESIDASGASLLADNTVVESWLAEKSDEEATNEEVTSGISLLSSASAPVLATNYYNGDEHSESSVDVVSSGRRAVKPYSWDYGDIWEKELKRTQSSETFPVEEDHQAIIPASFEEIRDDLFHKAELTTKGPKRRSRSADARTELQDNNQHDWLTSQSPFVRTVHQSTSKQHDITINIDEYQGRRVFPGYAAAIDDTWPSHVKNIAVETSTFKGPKPWSTIKRRPSGLRRRTTGNNNSPMRSRSFLSCQSSESDESLPTLGIVGHEESESSESYLSTTSSDCFTTDDTSACYDTTTTTTTSSSSPPISNRSSTAFSDYSPSEMNDLRRVIFQNPSLQDLAKSSIKHATQKPEKRMRQPEMTLNQRFSRINNTRNMFTTQNNRLLPVTNLYGSKKRHGTQHTTYHSTLNGQKRTPLLIRSDSDLNSLTRVQFVGDSYSRSNISKNVRQSRRRNPFSSSQTNNTRVVSCEILQEGNKDMCRRVNLTKEDYKNDRKCDDKYCSSSHHRSWQPEFAPQRGSCSQIRGAGIKPRSFNEKTVGRSYSNHEDDSLRAKLVEIQNIREHRASCHSASDTYHWCKSRGANNCRRYHSCRNTDTRPVAKKYTTIRNNFGAINAQSLAYEKTPHHRRLKNKDQVIDDEKSKPCLITSPFRSNFSKPDGKVGKNRQGTNSGDFIRSKSGHHSNSIAGVSKEPVIIKETSFVGAATFTKYQRTSQPVQRSRSCNEKDGLTKLSETKRERTSVNNMQMNCGLPYDSHRKNIQRRRRYSDGADFYENDQVVSPTYCDPHRQSIQEGSYCIESAQLAHMAVKPEEKNYQQLTADNEITTKRNSEEDMILRIDGKNKMVKIPEVVVTYAEENMIGLPEENMIGLQNEEQFIIKRFTKNNVASLRDSLEIIDNYDNCEENDESNEENDESTIVDVPESLNAIAICIDYRNKRPMSLQFHDERNKEISEEEAEEKIQAPCNEEILERVYDEHTTSHEDRIADAGSASENGGSDAGRWSRKDRHEQQILLDRIMKKKHEGNVLKTNQNFMKGEIEQSPVPYRRDKTIVYTDARNSFDSDTDSSVSHVSTVSSSGSDVTVILNDEQDISAEDFKHISHIGIGISPLELDSTDDGVPISGIDSDKLHGVNTHDWSEALADATQSAHGKYDTAPRSMSAWKTSNNQMKENNIFEVFNNDSKGGNNYFKYEHNLAKDVVYGTPGSMSSSTTSSIESNKGLGVPKHNKGFLSRLKGFRNSFRDKFRNISKNTERLEQDAMNDIKVNLGSRSLPIIDRNFNEITPGTYERPTSNMVRSSGSRKKAYSSSSSSSSSWETPSQVQHTIHSSCTSGGGGGGVGGRSSNLHKVIASKSSEHLHNLHVNNYRSKISAKSMEVLLETCI